jgi:hypothetical protein
MKILIVFVVAAASSGVLGAQERKPVPKDSVRVFVPGCSKGRVFTAGQPTEDQTGGAAVPEGTHLRMNGPKPLMAELKGVEGSRIEITGLIKRGQMAQQGVAIGRGVRISPGPGSSGGLSIGSGISQLMIDVEGWRRVSGECPGRK